MASDFLAVGDITTDTFIRLQDAEVHCSINKDECLISMPWGAKIPYEFAVEVHGVGNAANAAVSAARLGVNAGFLSWVGQDSYGDADVAALEKDKVDTSRVTRVPGVASNHDFVLWYGTERTILIKHNFSPYALPADLKAPRYLYLSSAGDNTKHFHADLAKWLKAHPETTFAFQPGLELGMKFDDLKELYAVAGICVCNKEEAEGILGKEVPHEMPELLKAMRAIGPKLVIITDGPNGAYAYDGAQILKVPMYPDPKPAYDRTGAGDAFASTVVAALSLGKPLEEALLWGPINSMSVVQKIGAQEGLLSREALEEWLKKAPADYRVETL